MDAEDAAIAQALDALEQGNIAAAEAALEPFSATAVRTRTLTTLSRVRLSEGSFDEAHALLLRAHSLDSADAKVWRLLAELLALLGRPTEEVQWRRKLAFAGNEVPARAYVDWVRALMRSAAKDEKPGLSELRLALRKLASAPDATADVIVQMAEIVYGAPSLADDALALYRSASPCPAGQREATARWWRMIDWCAESGIEATRLTEDGEPGSRPTVAHFRDVLVFPAFNWVPVLDAGRVVLSGFTAQRMPLRSDDPSTPVMMSNRKTAVLRFAESVESIDTPALLMGGSADHYQNTIHFLSTLAVAETAQVGLDRPLVIHAEPTPLQLEMLAFLGYPEDRLIRVAADRPARFSQLTVVSRLVRGGRWVDPMVARWFRERFVPLALRTVKPSRRLYLSSRTALRARVVNEDEVVTALSERGFETVECERLGLEAVVELFSQASIIVGSTGTAMAHLVFAQPGAAVLELANRHEMQGVTDMPIHALAVAGGMRADALPCRPATVHSGQAVAEADLKVDISEMLEHLGWLEQPAPSA